MHIDYIILAIAGGIEVAGGLYLLRETKKYRARQKNASLASEESWLHEPVMKEKLARTDEWMRDNPDAETNLNKCHSKDNTRKIILKHIASDGRDCELEWNVDFARMEIVLRVPFISPALLLDFIFMLPHYDERFQQTGITGVMNMSSRFRIKLRVPHGQEGVWYSCRIYKSGIPDSKTERLELELSGLPFKKPMTAN